MRLWSLRSPRDRGDAMAGGKGKSPIDNCGGTKKQRDQGEKERRWPAVDGHLDAIKGGDKSGVLERGKERGAAFSASFLSAP